MLPDDKVSAAVLDASIRLHRELGPGLFESVYEAGLAWTLRKEGFRVQRQAPIPLILFGERLDEGFRADLIIDDLVIVEVKAIESLAPIHRRQLLTYLRLSDRWLGVLVNFGGYRLLDGYERIVNGQPRNRAQAIDQPRDVPG